MDQLKTLMKEWRCYSRKWDGSTQDIIDGPHCIMWDRNWKPTNQGGLCSTLLQIIHMQPRFRFLSNIQLRKFSGSEQTYSTDEINCNHQYSICTSIFEGCYFNFFDLYSPLAIARQSSCRCHPVVLYIYKILVCSVSCCWIAYWELLYCVLLLFREIARLISRL